MKIAIVYKSFLGSTEKYANWLKEEFFCDLYKFGDMKNNKISEYDTLIIMSGTYMGWMPLTKFLLKKWDILKNKNIFVISVGEASVDDPLSAISYNKIKEEIKSKIKYYKIAGSMKNETKGNVQKENLNKIIKEIKLIESQ